MSKKSTELQSGTFGSGFLLGVLAGATAHFLTSTAEGKKFAGSIAEKWTTVSEYTQQTLAEQGLSKDNKTVAHYFQVLKNTIAQWAEVEHVVAQKKARAEKKQAAAADPTRKKTRRFKGV